MRITEPGRGSQRYSHARIPTGAYLPVLGQSGSSEPDSGWGAARPSVPHYVDVLVIGAGQAGLATAFELRYRGFHGYATDDGAPTGRQRQHHSRRLTAPHHTFLVLDAEYRPGGAWQHRWPTLTMATVNHIADLPGLPVGSYEPSAEAADVVPSYFADFEDIYDLPILRPVLVHSIENDIADETVGGDSHETRGLLRVETTAGTFMTRAIVNCTGTWTRPFLPYYPGASQFRGRQYHTQDYPGPRPFAGQRVMVVGGGISALSHVDDLGDIAKTFWVTRTPPRWRAPWPDEEEQASGRGPNATHTTPNADDDATLGATASSLTMPFSRALTPEEGRAIEARVRARVERGLQPLPVVAETGLPINEWTLSLRQRGLLERRPMFEKLTSSGAAWADGSTVAVDSIIWATGFRAELRHLAPLKLRSAMGGIPLEGTRVKSDPRIHLIGYGPSASTIGARSAARKATREIVEFLATME